MTAGTIVNKYSGTCSWCGATVAAGEGLAERGARVSNGRYGKPRYVWTVRHVPMVWHGSPTSGLYVHGCPGQAEDMNTRGGFGRTDERSAT